MSGHGELWGIAAYFNPCGFRRRLGNYRRFREALRRQGLPLLVIELALEGGAGFQIPDGDADVLLRLSGRDWLWQTERMWNVALSHLPAHCDKVVTLDADLVFEDRRWIERTCDLLERHAVVQPYERGHYMKPHHSDSPDRVLGSGRKPQFVRLSLASELVRGVSGGRGQSGFAWAYRREVLDEVGFYDAMVLGGNDRVMVNGFSSPEVEIGLPLTGAMARHVAGYVKRLHDRVRGRFSFAPGTVWHLWHGDMADRRYDERHQWLIDHDFDPARDLRHDAGGPWEWASDKPELQRLVRAYFAERREDGRSPSGAS